MGRPIYTRKWFYLAQDRAYWRTLLNAALNLRVPLAMKLVYHVFACERKIELERYLATSRSFSVGGNACAINNTATVSCVLCGNLTGELFFGSDECYHSANGINISIIN